MPQQAMRRTLTIRALILVGAVLAISALHYATPLHRPVLHALYQRLYYVPVILAAYWFGVTGGLSVAVLSGIAYAPHIHTAWAQNAPYTMSQYVELAVFLSLGVAVGLIASRERRLGNRFRNAAESLERANQELRASSEQLRRAERLSALGEIAAGLAHEIRNPLAGMKGALEIVSSRTAPGTPEAEFAGVATRELRRLEALVQEFLDFARPRPPRLLPTAMSDVLARAVALMSPEAERAGVELTLARGGCSPTLRIDPEQIQQVLVNVVLNAIQASPRGGQVTLGYREEDGNCLVEVADRGPGIKPGVRRRLFEPFFTTKERGTGLGLAMSQRIVAAHGGEIRVDSTEGRGTTVKIVLPRRVVQPVEAQQ